MIRVVLADDHELIRRGLAALLEKVPDILVCGLAETGEDAVVQAREHAPDVVVLDLSMPGAGGIAAASEILAGGGTVRALMLSGRDDAALVRAALRAGATGYLLKDDDAAQVIDAIRAVHRGELRLSPDVARALAADGLDSGASDSPDGGINVSTVPEQRRGGDDPSRWQAPWAPRPTP
jgi:DNA-binding NarL/FixJ family response regulator